MRKTWAVRLSVGVCASILFVAMVDILYANETSPKESKDGEVASEKQFEASSVQAPPRFDLKMQEIESPYQSGSVIVDRPHTVVRLSPTNRSKRRGVVMKGQRLPYITTASGPGCRNDWYNTHTDGWICGDDLELSDLPPDGDKFPVLSEGDLTPWSYGFVREPTLEYVMRGGVLQENRELLKGFGFGVRGRVNYDGSGFFKTASGTLVPRKSAGITGRISEFEGMLLREGDPWPIGFVNAKQAWVYSSPVKSKENRAGKVERYQPFHAMEIEGKGKKTFVRFDDGGWLEKRDVRVARNAEIPEGVAENEKWIDVDTKEQIVTAYEGSIPVYVTLTSSGRVGASRTVKGSYRIWVKVSAIAMDNTDEELEAPEEEAVEAEDLADAGVPDETKLYSLHDVPWVQFFFESYGIHGVYWHDRFGNRRSHGCVNMAPKDARWFFDWTHPVLPDGWWAIHGSPADKGTLVRVR